MASIEQQQQPQQQQQTPPHLNHNNETNNTPTQDDTPDSPSDDDEKKDSLAEKKTGRRKINIEFIEDKSRRHITFSKRKAGIMKKAYELSTLTGTQVLLLVASETGHVYTFATPKLQPLITKAEGKNLIQSCLNAQEPPPLAPVVQQPPRIAQTAFNEPNLMYATGTNNNNGGGGNDLIRDNSMEVYDEEKKENKGYLSGMENNPYGSSSTPFPTMGNSIYSMPSMVNSTLPRGYLPPTQYSSTPTGPHVQYSTSVGPSGVQYATHATHSYPYASGLPPAPWSKPSNPGNMQLNTQQHSGHSQQTSGLMQQNNKDQPEHST